MSTRITLTNRIGRPADRQELIIQELRDQIVAGQLSPGCRLPNRDEIGQKYGAGANTVQRALDRLKLDGFVYSSGRNGTFVSAEPPHLTRYAVVFPALPSQSQAWVRFWTALTNEAISIQNTQNRKLPLYYGINEDAATDDYQSLLQDVLAHRVAGIIFASSIHSLIGSPIVDEPGIPRVAIMMPHAHAHIPAIYPNVDTFFHKAVTHLHQQGCRKIAFINPPGLESHLERLQYLTASYGMEMRPYWHQIVSLSLPHTARNITHLLMNSGQSERPDALVISDDNLVEHATAGLLEAGVQVPNEVQIVAHCNFPWPTPHVVPVTRVGFSAREVLQTAISHIDAMQCGEEVARNVAIEARFEDETADTKPA